MHHYTIFVNNTVNTSKVIASILHENNLPEFKIFNKHKGEELSKSRIDELINEEETHDIKIATSGSKQALKSMSSGEQKKIVLEYLLSTQPDYLILDNPFDNLDTQSTEKLKLRLEKLSSKIILIVLLTRKTDALHFINNLYRISQEGKIEKLSKAKKSINDSFFQIKIPQPLNNIYRIDETLIHLKNINVSYQNKPIITNINWRIKTGEFWQLKGENGSGKSTLLSMITGENSKGYGQDLYLFGQKKGSGESIWDIKKKIGYYSPTLTHNFYGEHTIEHMLISGLNDSIGLYKHPTELQINLAKEWLILLNMHTNKKALFIELPIGQQRLIMIARAMIKQPLLLILDEPTENLDDESAAFFVALTNKIASESNTAIIFISHRDEPGLKPKNIFELQPSQLGSIGVILK